MNAADKVETPGPVDRVTKSRKTGKARGKP